MRGSIRLAALMGCPSIFVYTHDSIGLGEDGPTHQPIEHLAALRAMPVLTVVRPAGANETALAWRYAIAIDRPPDARSCSRARACRPGTPPAIPRDAIERGAYVLRDSYQGAGDAGTDPDRHRHRGAHLRSGAADLLEAEGIATRVVSMPCMEHFADQDDAYRDAVLPAACRARVSLEAASHVRLGPLGRRRRRARSGCTRFGASAPAGALYKHFGFTPERVADAGRAVVKSA